MGLGLSQIFGTPCILHRGTRRTFRQPAPQS